MINRHFIRFCGGVIGILCIGFSGCVKAGRSGQGQTPPPAESQSSIYAFKMNDIDGFPTPLSRYRGKALLVVNVASECRFTNQYENLQKLI